MNRASKTSNADMDRVEKSLAEAGDKINSLVSLMDQHLSEHSAKS